MGAPLGIPGQGALGSLTNKATQLGQAQQILHLSEGAIGGNASDAQALLSAGVTLASSAGPGGATLGAALKVGLSLVNVGMAIASGAAMGGPIGACAGAVAELVSDVLSPTPPQLIRQPSQAATETYNARKQWYSTGHVGGATNKAEGYSFFDYLGQAFPAHKTLRTQDLFYARSQSWAEYIDANIAAGHGDDNLAARLDDFYHGRAAGLYGNGAKLFAVNFAKDQPTGWPGKDASAYAAMVQTVATNIPFLWGDLAETDLQPSPSTTPKALASRDYWGVATAMPSVKDLLTLAQDDIIPLTSNGKTLTRSQIWDSAVKRRPDPLYFAADLYVWGNTTGGSWSLTQSSWTTLYNLEALNMLSTWCAMLIGGASTRAILSELLTQQMSIYTQSGNNSVPWLCRMMVEDLVRMAHQEWKETKAGQPKAPPSHLTKNLTTKTVSSFPATTSAQQAIVASASAALPVPSGPGVGTALGVAGGAAVALGAAYKYLL